MCSAVRARRRNAVDEQELWFKSQAPEISFVLGNSILMMRRNYIATILFVGLFTLVLSFWPEGNYVYSAEVKQVEKIEAKAEPMIIRQICSCIYRGDFEGARRIIDSCDKKDKIVQRLDSIISEYESIEEKRQQKRQEKYEEELAALKNLESAGVKDTNDANDADDVNNVSCVNDSNDANDPKKVLAAIEDVTEFTNKAQKQALLKKDFVKRTFLEAQARAARLESEGKWLDAYLDCYNWLRAIDEDNETYSQRAEELITKANIAASFEDSPCETSEERYEGVKKELFIRALRALHHSYVSVIDYGEMAVEGIERCRLLGEVMKVRAERTADSNEQNGEYKIVPEHYSAWCRALSELEEQISELSAGVTKDKFVDIFNRILVLNNDEQAGMKLPEKVLISHFSEATLSSLDPYTLMVWPRETEDFNKLMTNEFSGIGIEITRKKGLLTVASLLPGTPAYRSGLDAGDIITHVDGVETKEMSLSCAVKNITGPKGTDVRLSTRRPGEKKTRDIVITRDTIVVPPLRGWQRTRHGQWRYMVDHQRKIGYVRLTSFDSRTAGDLEKVITELESDGMRGLVLDLRYNSGGLLTSAIEVTDKFLREGLIVSTHPRRQSITYAEAKEEGTHPDYPLVILVNWNSASASEIVAGALADEEHERAIVVGERTHGKGSVQGITPYPGEGAQLKYTMAYYHLPSGQRVKSRQASEKRGEKDWGVEPDVKIELRSDEVLKMYDVRRENDVLVQANHDSESRPVKKYTIEETLSADPQLATAILVVRAKLIEKGLNLES